jgi:cytochrome b6-f complex iron-sulfur subunit
MNRREFLAYVWLGSILLTLGGSTGILLWFAYPRFRAGEFGGSFDIDVASLPSTDAPPEDHPEGRFWLVNSPGGVLVLYKVCVHLGCLYKWVPSTNRFECPCHGSKYQATGEYIEGPAPRSLDRFQFKFVDESGATLAEELGKDMNTEPSAGQPIPVPAGATTLVINTGARIKGLNNS